MGVSQNLGYLFGVPIMRDITFLGLCWGPPILGNYHIAPNSSPRDEFSRKGPPLGLGFRV